MRQLKRIVFVAAVLAASTLALPASAQTATHVVHPGESIQAAVDAAAPGDTVIVQAGTYRENVTINKSDLTLKAQGTVTLEPPSDGPGQCLWIQDVGICVAPAPGSYYRVRDVTISGFRVVGFPGSGIFGYHTRNLKVLDVVAIENAAYGVASFDGMGTTFTGNAVSGSHDAGIYIGDSLEADAVVSHNRALNNAFGILVRHSRRVLVSGNESRGNCIGVFLLADGQAGGSGETAVLNNTVVGNNQVCTQFDAAGFLPILGGGGIVLAGSQRNSVLFNDVRDNRSSTATMFSGGIVLIATPRANADGSFDASTANLVVLNRLRGNQPADIVNDAASTPNVIVGNQCRTSVPGGLCAF